MVHQHVCRQRVVSRVLNEDRTMYRSGLPNGIESAVFNGIDLNQIIGLSYQHGRRGVVNQRKFRLGRHRGERTAVSAG